jgi:hypothetical protein
MNELEELTKGIEGVLSLYSSLGKDFKDIDRLIVAKRKLSGYVYRFSVLVADALDLYNSSYASRKKVYAEETLKLIESGSTIKKAELTVELKHYKNRIEEGKAEAMYRKFKSQYDSLRDTMQSIQQDISTLKMELKDASIHNNG